MANEIVKYHHELNTIPLRKFTPVEMNLFWFCCKVLNKE
ncbi:RepB family plasmid replication initiator protein [Enterococcus faecium]